MQAMTLAQRICAQVLATARRPLNQVDALNLLRRLPRNRAEARRSIATKGRLARG
ncbi:hypothetical protein [Falsiroseomonas sp. CW058]|uniref:hypothetical protein n=1 Tax=Falsiroseomonas sp. CW058 TaxID=3388664 RepID=UPI003D317CBE